MSPFNNYSDRFFRHCKDGLYEDPLLAAQSRDPQPDPTPEEHTGNVFVNAREQVESIRAGRQTSRRDGAQTPAVENRHHSGRSVSQHPTGRQQLCAQRGRIKRTAQVPTRAKKRQSHTGRFGAACDLDNLRLKQRPDFRNGSRGVRLSFYFFRTATASISTRAPFGSAPICTQLLAGNGSRKNSA